MPSDFSSPRLIAQERFCVEVNITLENSTSYIEKCPLKGKKEAVTSDFEINLFPRPFDIGKSQLRSSRCDIRVNSEKKRRFLT